jgi:hypothetical protein
MTQPTPPTSELLRELAATHGDVLESALRRGYAPTQPTRSASVLQMLLDGGVNEQTAFVLTPVVIDWFDGMSVSLAEALLPSLVADLRSGCDQ